MLTAAELITLIKAHNKLVSIKVRASMKRETLIKLIEDNGYKVDHKNKKIVDAKKTRPRRPKVTLKEAQDMLPKPKTALQKQKAVERKEEKATEEKKKLRMAKKEAVEQSKKGTKKENNKPKSILKDKVSNNKKEESMGDTAFIKQQKKLQLEKQKETRRALLKQNVKVDKTTRRGKPVKKEEPKKEGIKIIEGSKNTIVMNTKELIDYINSKFKLVKQPNKSQISKMDSLFKLVDINPKYITSINVGTTRGADPSPYDEGNVYIEPFYREKGKDIVPDNLDKPKFIKFKGEPVK